MYPNSCQVFVLTYEFMALHKSKDTIVALCKYQITISHKISHEVLHSRIVDLTSFCKQKATARWIFKIILLMNSSIIPRIKRIKGIWGSRGFEDQEDLRIKRIKRIWGSKGYDDQVVIRIWRSGGIQVLREITEPYI